MIMPEIIDRYHNQRNGKRKYIGQIVQLTPKKKVIAAVYGDSLKQMRARKYAVLEALRKLEEPKRRTQCPK